MSQAVSTEPPAPAPKLSAARGLSAAVFSRFLARALGLGLAVIVARSATQTTFASYSYLLVLAALVSMITESGVSLVASREVAQQSVSVADAYRAGLPVVAGMSVVTAILVYVFGLVDNGPGTYGWPLLWTSAFIGVNVLFNFQAGLLRAQGKPWLEAGLQMLASLAMVAGGILVLATDWGLAALMAILVIKQLIVVCLAQIWLPLPHHGRATRERSLNLLRRGLWLGGATTCMGILLRAGYVTLGNTGDDATVAVYAVAARVLEVVVLIGETVGYGLLPAMAERSATGGLGAYRRKFARGLAGLVVGLPVAVLLTPLAVRLAFGSRYDGAATAAQIYCGAIPVVLALYLAWYGLVAVGREREVLHGAAFGAVVSLAAIAVVIADPTATMVAVATVVPLSACAAFLWWRVVQDEVPDDAVPSWLAAG
jgi:O-antigen/teichoic acid export membrane protein